MLKRIAAFLGALLLLGSLTACQSSSSGGSAPPGSPQSKQREIPTHDVATEGRLSERLDLQPGDVVKNRELADVVELAMRNAPYYKIHSEGVVTLKGQDEMPVVEDCLVDISNVRSGTYEDANFAQIAQYESLHSGLDIIWKDGAGYMRHWNDNQWGEDVRDIAKSTLQGVVVDFSEIVSTSEEVMFSGTKEVDGKTLDIYTLHIPSNVKSYAGDFTIVLDDQDAPYQMYFTSWRTAADGSSTSDVLVYDFGVPVKIEAPRKESNTALEFELNPPKKVK